MILKYDELHLQLDTFKFFFSFKSNLRRESDFLVKVAAVGFESNECNFLRNCAKDRFLGYELATHFSLLGNDKNLKKVKTIFKL